MGLTKTLRWLRDPQYRAYRKWVSDRGDTTKRFDVNLTTTDTIVVIGAYKGGVTAELAQRFGCTIHAFEPIEQFADAARARCAAFKNVTIHGFGLAAENTTASISLEGDASSRNRGTSDTVVATFKDVADVFDKLGIEDVGFMMINIEGDEYTLIPSMIDSGLMRTVNQLQVQFHLIKPADARQYDLVATRLSTTHNEYGAIHSFGSSVRGFR
jgi:FkbM family methyltransferase